MFHKHKTQVIPSSMPNDHSTRGMCYWLNGQDGFLSGALQGSFQCFLINLAMESVPWLCRRRSKVSRDQQCGLFPVRSDFVVFIWCLLAIQLHIETGLPSAPTQLPPPHHHPQPCIQLQMQIRIPEALVSWASEGSRSHLCPQEKGNNCFKLIRMWFCGPIDSHLNSVICGHGLEIQAMEMTSLSADSLWWKMTHIRKQSEPKETSVINHHNYNVLGLLCKSNPQRSLAE